MPDAPETPLVCIVSTQHPARNPRAVKEADALTAAGFHVELLTIRSHRPSLELDRTLLRGRSWRLEYAVDLLGSTPAGRLRAARLRLRTRLARELVRRFGLQMPHALGPLDELRRAAAARRADLYCVHVDGGIWIGAQLLRTGRRVAADFEDWYSEDLLPENRACVPVGLLQRSEAALLRDASFITTTSHALADALHARYGGHRPEVVPNAFPLGPSRRRNPTGVPALLWFSQTIGPGRGLEPFIAAWGQTRAPSRLGLLGTAHPGFEATLRRLLPAHRQADFTVRAAVPPDQLPAAIAAHDIGLALESASIPSRDLTITNKILQYLNAGLAVLATATSGQREVFTQEPRIGRLISLADRPALISMLDEVLSDTEALHDQQARARQLAERVYCWERHADRVVALAQSAVGSISA